MSSQGAPITLKKTASQQQPTHHHQLQQQQSLPQPLHQQQKPLSKQGSLTENNPLLDDEAPVAPAQPKDSHVSQPVAQTKPLPKQSSKREEIVQAIYDYEAQGPQELSFKTGDLLT